MLFGYEVSPCGYGFYHQIQNNGHDVEKVAPLLNSSAAQEHASSLIGEKRKNLHV